MALGLTQPLTEMSNRNQAHNLPALCELIIGNAETLTFHKSIGLHLVTGITLPLNYTYFSTKTYFYYTAYLLIYPLRIILVKSVLLFCKGQYIFKERDPLQAAKKNMKTLLFTISK
jgi:hypothetical protein